MRTLLLPALLAGLIARTAHAADIGLNIEIPRLDVAEYHRPYVAVWIERPDNTVVGDLAVWYDVAMKNGEGKEWLKDLRQWWRRSGRNQEFPVDGVSGATRAPGKHSLSFSDSGKPLADLKPGQYAVVVEAAREVGDRELVRVPFDWPPTQAAQLGAQGQGELGAIVVELKP